MILSMMVWFWCLKLSAKDLSEYPNPKGFYYVMICLYSYFSTTKLNSLYSISILNS